MGKQVLGLFTVFQVLWVFPCLAVVSWWRSRNFHRLFEIFILVACAYAQLFIAQDTSRMFTLAFMVMFISLDHLLETDRFRIRHWAFAALFFQILIPQLYTAGDIIEIWHSASTWAFTEIF